ncbi:MAG: hypothetical protein PHF63_00275 [Herbinix sp.]|nr:hypothetical protein [Herbinix sp.]
MDDKYSAVCEVGVFGSLNIEDPTCIDIDKKDLEEELILESIQRNLKNLTN